MNIRDPMLPLSLVAFRALQDEVSRLDTAIAAQAQAEPARVNFPEPIAEIGPDYSLRFVGAEPIATLLGRHPGVRVGTFMVSVSEAQAYARGTLQAERNRIAAKLEADAATMRHTQGCKGARDPHREAKARYAEVIAKLLREGRF